MKVNFLSFVAIDKRPLRWLTPIEYVSLGYLVLTSAVILLNRSAFGTAGEVSGNIGGALGNAGGLFASGTVGELLVGRAHVLAVTLALWVVYRLLPCRATMLCRTLGQLALLSWWYPDTFEINRHWANLDHVFAGWEQQLFGCQPALHFSQALPWAWFSELMDLGYASYYPMIALAAVYYFFARKTEFQRATFTLVAAFFICYTIYIFLPVAGPTYYYQAAGLDNIVQGVFPAVGDHFHYSQQCLPAPGYADGTFYQMVEAAKEAGERPTAAFPSSHVAISTIIILLLRRCRPLLYVLLPLYVLLCFATVYIQAHYAIDALAGLITGVALYYGLWTVGGKVVKA